MMRTARFEVAMGGGKMEEDVGVRACVHACMCLCVWGERVCP